MPRTDLFGECYTGAHREKLQPDEFQQLFCRLCRSERCSLSAVGKSLHALRMENQEDILLTNPRFGNPNDPQYAEIRAMQFTDMLRQAMALEISSQRGDWEIPTQEDAVRFAQEAAGDVTPPNFQVDEKTPEPEDTVLWQGYAQGRKNDRYQILLTQHRDEEPAWSCTCPAFQYKTAGPEGCKHITEARELYEAQVDAEEVEVVDEPVLAPNPEPPPKPGPAPAAQVPKTHNTRFPSEGLMVDGSSPPPPEPPSKRGDPWAPPPDPEPKGKVVAVHGKVKMGGSDS